MTQDPNNPGLPPENSPPPAAGAPLQYAGDTPNVYAGPPPTKDEQTMGLVCHLTAIFGWLNWVGPLIIFSTRKESAFLQDQSKQALNWALTVVVFFFLPVLFIWCPPLAMIMGIVVLLAGIGNLIICIMAAVKANQGIAFRYPFSFKFIK